MDKNLKLSELILRGAEVAKGQCWGCLRNDRDELCVIGAVYLGKHVELPKTL